MMFSIPRNCGFPQSSTKTDYIHEIEDIESKVVKNNNFHDRNYARRKCLQYTVNNC